ncbi:hypothetical protein HDV57DRAFT_496200 [Trichoderma longibrachiatum]
MPSQEESRSTFATLSKAPCPPVGSDWHQYFPLAPLSTGSNVPCQTTSPGTPCFAALELLAAGRCVGQSLVAGDDHRASVDGLI